MFLKLYPENPNPRYIKMIIECLENDGVDNWSWYMEGRKRFIADALDITEAKVRDEDLDFIDVAKAALYDFEEF